MAKKKEKKAGKRMKKKELVKVLLEFFHTKQDEVLSLKYIFEQLHLTTHPLKMLCMDILSELLMDDYITEVDKYKYKLNNHGVEMTGTFQRKSNGKNSFIPEGGGEPIFIAERNSAHAMNNDKVRIAFYAKRRGREAEGEVIEILERANDTFVGTLEVAKSYAFLVTENRTLANDIFIPKEKLKGGKTGDKAIVKIVEWPDKAKNPIGQVIDILGRAGDNTTEMHAILAEFGLPYVYPAAVEKAAYKIPAEIPAEEIAKREDFRGVTTFTIDPKDAKDFDDALSIRKLKEGLWEVGVHIADVTHYVKEGSIIDKEAEKRATSVYLVDRTIPMLPERLCNFICSLRPDEEKLDNLAQFIARFGYKLRTSGTKTDISKSINHLLDDIQGKKEENLIETVSIRAMQKARYSVHNVGHYGLAFDYYTHFTSPIRRFPDMMVHRLLTKYLDQGGRSVSEKKYEALCEHSSSMEQIAANAERASIKYKQVEFMTEHLGETYDGVISGVTEWGLYVELNENKCEGMIPIRDLDDDYYEFDEKNYCLRGRRKNRTYSLGDAITVKVARANLEKKQLDFALV